MNQNEIEADKPEPWARLKATIIDWSRQFEFFTKNERGVWVPAIEEPYPLRPFFFDFYQCRCGRSFWGKQRYCEHYAHDHILSL